MGMAVPRWFLLTGAVRAVRAKRREFEGMIPVIITFVMSSSQQPPATHPATHPATLRLARTSKEWLIWTHQKMVMSRS